MGRDLLCVFDDEGIVREMKPDMEKMKALDGLLLHVTARGREVDCVSRSFAPKLGVAEDSLCHHRSRIGCGGRYSISVLGISRKKQRIQ